MHISAPNFMAEFGTEQPWDNVVLADQYIDFTRYGNITVLMYWEYLGGSNSNSNLFKINTFEPISMFYTNRDYYRCLYNSSIYNSNTSDFLITTVWGNNSRGQKCGMIANKRNADVTLMINMTDTTLVTLKNIRTNEYHRGASGQFNITISPYEVMTLVGTPLYSCAGVRQTTCTDYACYNGTQECIADIRISSEICTLGGCS